MKQTNYFSHDSNARNDDKLIRLRMRYKAAGYGVYFMILERLREETDYMCVKDYNSIAFDLREDAALIKSVVEDFGLFAFTDDGKCFYSESFTKRMQVKDDLSKKRSEAGKQGNEKRWTDKRTAAAKEVKDAKGSEAPQKEDSSNNNAFMKKFFQKSNKAQLETLLMNFGLKPKDIPILKKTTKEVLAEWEISNKQHDDYTDWARHLIATIRIKLKEKGPDKDVQPPTTDDYRYDGGFGSKDF